MQARARDGEHDSKSTSRGGGWVFTAEGGKVARVNENSKAGDVLGAGLGLFSVSFCAYLGVKSQPAFIGSVWVMSVQPHPPRCALAEGHTLGRASHVARHHPSSFGKVTSHNLHLLFTKRLLSAFSVPGAADTKMKQPHPWPEDAASAAGATRAPHVLGSWAEWLGS